MSTDSRPALTALTPVRDAAGRGIGVVEFVDARATRSPWVARMPGYYGHSMSMLESAERWILEVSAAERAHA